MQPNKVAFITQHSCFWETKSLSQLMSIQANQQNRILRETHEQIGFFFCQWNGKKGQIPHIWGRMFPVVTLEFK